MRYLRTFYELVFGKGLTGHARVSKVLEHFRSLTRELSAGAAEIKDEMRCNQRRVVTLQERIDSIKEDNTELGADFVDATDLQRGLINLIGGGADATTN